MTARSIGDLRDIVRTSKARGASLKVTRQPTHLDRIYRGGPALVDSCREMKSQGFGATEIAKASASVRRAFTGTWKPGSDQLDSAPERATLKDNLMDQDIGTVCNFFAPSGARPRLPKKPLVPEVGAISSRHSDVGPIRGYLSAKNPRPAAPSVGATLDPGPQAEKNIATICFKTLSGKIP